MGYPMVYPDEQSGGAANVERHSSIVQYSDAPLTVIKGGVALPIEFDTIDYILCDCVVSHRSMLVSNDDIGYHYKTGVCRLTSDIYTVYDKDGKVVYKPLPAYYGEGTYATVESGLAIAVGDDSALGIHNEEELRIGLDFVKAGTIVSGEE